MNAAVSLPVAVDFGEQQQQHRANHNSNDPQAGHQTWELLDSAGMLGPQMIDESVMREDKRRAGSVGLAR